MRRRRFRARGRRPEDPKVRCPDITKARTLLKWEPKVSLEEGLRRTAEYFRQLTKAPRG